MGYQIFAKEKSPPDGPCVRSDDAPFDSGMISGRSLDCVPGVHAFSVDGHNARSTAQRVRAWASELARCLEWIREKMAENCAVTLGNGNTIDARSADGTTASYLANRIVEHCREQWEECTWTPEDACLDLSCEINGLIHMAEWLEKHAGKEFVHSY